MANVSFKALADKPKGKAALRNGEQHAMSTSSLVPVIWAYIDAGFKPDHAEKIDATVKDLVAKAYEKRTGVMQPVTSLSGGVRISEMKGMLKCGEWACAKQLFATLADIGVSQAMLVKVTTWFRKKSGVAKDKGVAPTRAVLLAQIAAKQPKRSATAKTPVQRLKAAPLAFINAMIDDAKVVSQVYAKQFSRSDAATLTNMIKSLASIKAAVAVKVLEAKAE